MIPSAKECELSYCHGYLNSLHAVIILDLCMANRKDSADIDTTLVNSFSAVLYFKLTHLKWYYLQRLSQLICQEWQRTWKRVRLACLIGVCHQSRAHTSMPQHRMSGGFDLNLSGVSSI